MKKMKYYNFFNKTEIDEQWQQYIEKEKIRILTIFPKELKELFLKGKGIAVKRIEDGDTERLQIIIRNGLNSYFFERYVWKQDSKNIDPDFWSVRKNEEHFDLKYDFNYKNSQVPYAISKILINFCNQFEPTINENKCFPTWLKLKRLNEWLEKEHLKKEKLFNKIKKKKNLKK